ncbi:hypothetical protein M9434_003083 [Picochlorum sp. BPE23]|nr:hypothetical protein M9434_003083 [Picochlorum sp. BPE23]
MVVGTRPFNVVLWGSTGFTGRLVAEHMMQRYAKDDIKWAMAGRSKEKVQTIRDSLAEKYGVDAESVPILVGDSNDLASLESIASSTDVILSTAGPFSLYGTNVVDAAVLNGCDYVDITGETPWVQGMIRKHHETAKQKGIRIIPCCGYDSTPSDMGAWVVEREAKRRGKKLVSARTMLLDSRGGVSGGTIASGLEIAADPENRKKDLSPYAFIPEGESKGEDKDVWVPKTHMGVTLAPTIMQAINSRVVQRSNYLLDWGKSSFSYSEMIAVKSKVQAWMVSIATGIGVFLFSQPWLHGLLKKIVPAPGQGPSRELMMSGYYKHLVVGETEDGEHIFGEFSDSSRDPGYWGTSRLVLEAALCLALNKKELDECPDVLHGGVLTPASALGPVLQKRLEDAGIVCRITESPDSIQY